LILFQCLRVGAKLYLASKLTENAISGRMQFSRYIGASIALRYGTSGPRFSSSSSPRRKWSFSRQVIEQPLECSKNDLSPCKSASRLFLCMLIDKQKFYLENVKSISQDKILSFQDLLSQTHFLNKWQFL
jgi:hypothetical protein